MHSAASDVYPPQLLAAIIPDRTLAEFSSGCEEQLDSLARDDFRAQISTILILQAKACDFRTGVTGAERQDRTVRSIEQCPSAAAGAAESEPCGSSCLLGFTPST